MGAKTWMLVYADADVPEVLQAAPRLDREATAGLVARLFPGVKLEPLDDGTLSWTNPPDNELYAASFGAVSIVAAKEFGIDVPSRLASAFVTGAGSKAVYLHAMHSVVDWFAFAKWVDGKLVRSLSLSPDSGIMENVGEPLPFEQPYWGGQHSEKNEDDADDAYPFPFHPLDMGEAALAALFGYQLEGEINPSLLDPETVPLMRFRRVKPFWRFW